MRVIVSCLLFSVLALAQDATPSPAEQRFTEALSNVTMDGFYTTGESSDLKADRYVIIGVSKVKDDLWKFDARVQYNQKDVPISLTLPVKFAGDTPVISLTNFAIPGFGSFTARILIFEGSYAGMWGDAKRGGKMFGKIVKNAPSPSR